MADPVVPNINGEYYDQGSVEVKIGNTVFVGVTDVKYKATVTRKKLRGTARQPIGRTGGFVDYEGSITLYQPDLEDLLNALGDGFASQKFNVTITYRADGFSTVVDQMIGCKIDEIGDKGSSEGEEPVKVPLKLNVMKILFNGKEVLRGLK